MNMNGINQQTGITQTTNQANAAAADKTANAATSNPPTGKPATYDNIPGRIAKIPNWNNTKN